MLVMQHSGLTLRVCTTAALLLALLHLSSAVLPSALPVPETCNNGNAILRGERFSMRMTADEEPLDCSFSLDSGLGSSTTVDSDTQNGTTVLYESGPVNFQCGMLHGKFSLLEGKHLISLCNNCSSRDLIIRQREQVSWRFGDRIKCNLTIKNRCNSTEMRVSDSHVFNNVGVYQLTCQDNCSVLATITVIEEGTTNYNSTLAQLYQDVLNNSCEATSLKELIYTHAGIMGFTFGIILPLGALSAHMNLWIVHVITQPIGLLLAVIGFAMTIAYRTVNAQPHFNSIHSILGLVLLLASLLQPTLRLVVCAPIKAKWEILFKGWHKRLGAAIVFFGLANVFLGFISLGNTHLEVMVFYGVWVALSVFVFVVLGAFKKDKDGSLSFKKYDNDCDACSPTSFRTADKISLSSPSKLSKEIISESKFVQVRKKSVDMLDMTEFKPNHGLCIPEPLVEENETISEQPKPRRKISNVHFVLSGKGQSTPPHPYTPPIEHKSVDSRFGFTNRASLDHTADQEDGNGEDRQSSQSDSEIESDISPNSPLTPNMLQNTSRYSVDSIASQNSLRITRHSKRATVKEPEIFLRSNSMRNTHTKIPLINTPSPLTKHSISHNPPKRPASLSSCSTSDSDDEDSSIQQVSEPALDCSFHQEQLSPPSPPPHLQKPEASPLQQRRARKMAIGLDQKPPSQTDLLIPSPTQTHLQFPRRSPSRSPTRRRSRQELLVDSALRSVMSMSEDAIVCANAQGELVFWSSGAVKMFGYTPGEAIGSSLQMIMPHRYKERHQGGINSKTDEAIKYIRKHGTAPEEQKHSRLYAVHGMSKTGNEFAVDVVVSSFVIEGEIFYTGIITEIANQGGLTRNQSVSALSTETEIREKHQKALAIGAQMKIAHKLRSAEHISKRELKNVLQGSLKATEFEVTSEESDSMVDGIMKAGDPDNHGVIKFVNLIDLLSKHRLYISDSGLIAKYGRTIDGNSSMTRGQKLQLKLAEFFSRHAITAAWSSLYILLNILLWVIGVVTHNMPWMSVGRWAYGAGPVLSMNCVLVLLPTMTSLINSMRGNVWFNKIFPLTRNLFFHLLIIGGIFFWSVVHTLLHIASLAVDRNTTTVNLSMQELITTKIVPDFLNPIITGCLVIGILLVMTILAVSQIRQLCRFIGFHVMHWVCMGLIYLVLLIHGRQHFNPSFWKWLLPSLIAFSVERFYRFFLIKKHRIEVTNAALYDNNTRVIQIEAKKPQYFHFTPGQYVLIKIPEIGPLAWHPVILSCSPKEDMLTFYLPSKGDAWLTKAFKNFKSNPVKQEKPEEANLEVVKPLPPRANVEMMIRGPYGVGTELLFDQKFAVLVCGGDAPHSCKAIIQKFLQYRRASACNCGCHPVLSKLYFIWVTPSGNDFEWFTDYLSDINEDEHLQKYLDIRIFLTNINSPPDELASALLHLGLKTASNNNTIVKRPSLPQLNNLFPNTSYGLPDFESLLDFVSVQHATSTNKKIECGVFTIGDLPYSMLNNLRKSCKICSLKRGPQPSPADLMASPYRKKSLQETIEISQIPKEWHISFNLHKIIV